MRAAQRRGSIERDFPPFGRRVAVRTLRQIKINGTQKHWRLTPHVWKASCPHARGKRPSGALPCFLGLPIPVSETHTRRYVNGHPKNGFFAANENGNAQRRAQNHAHWHRDPGCAGCNLGFCAKKVS